MGPREFFESLEARADRSMIEGIDHSYLFEIGGEGSWLVDIRNGALHVSEGAAPADVTISVSSETFEKLASGKQNPVTAYMTGKLKVTGDTGAALKLQKIF